jgi:hypothetical protein
MNNLSVGVQQTIYLYLNGETKIKILKLSIIDPTNNIFNINFLLESLNRLKFPFTPIKNYNQNDMCRCTTEDKCDDCTDIDQCVDCDKYNSYKNRKNRFECSHCYDNICDKCLKKNECIYCGDSYCLDCIDDNSWKCEFCDKIVCCPEDQELTCNKCISDVIHCSKKYECVECDELLCEKCYCKDKLCVTCSNE